jgi:hypothetical protein
MDLVEDRPCHRIDQGVLERPAGSAGEDDCDSRDRTLESHRSGDTTGEYDNVPKILAFRQSGGDGGSRGADAMMIESPVDTRDAA